MLGDQRGGLIPYIPQTVFSCRLHIVPTLCHVRVRARKSRHPCTPQAGPQHFPQQTDPGEPVTPLNYTVAVFALDSCRPVIYPYTGLNCTLIFLTRHSQARVCTGSSPGSLCLFLNQKELMSVIARCPSPAACSSRITCRLLGLGERPLSPARHLSAPRSTVSQLTAILAERSAAANNLPITSHKLPGVSCHPFSELPQDGWAWEGSLGGWGGKRPLFPCRVSPIVSPPLLHPPLVNLRNLAAQRFQGHSENQEGEV